MGGDSERAGGGLGVDGGQDSLSGEEEERKPLWLWVSHGNFIFLLIIN